MSNINTHQLPSTGYKAVTICGYQVPIQKKITFQHVQLYFANRVHFQVLPLPAHVKALSSTNVAHLTPRDKAQ